ncbi:hypothetical protein F0562_020191 [Nyssa sinensis]|uniref:Uncharacterized protein n=1 Tax=Nyssa sinensis TaxID=561372 RepID=A0A5J5BUG4_9ASTE|nr:hypothetical protein F0562_020191 [Nyssa sinensis]
MSCQQSADYKTVNANGDEMNANDSDHEIDRERRLPVYVSALPLPKITITKPSIFSSPLSPLSNRFKPVMSADHKAVNANGDEMNADDSDHEFDSGLKLVEQLGKAAIL